MAKILPPNNYITGAFSAASYAETVADIGTTLNGSAAFTIGAWVNFHGLGTGTSILAKEGEFNLSIAGHELILQITGFPPVSADLNRMLGGNEVWGTEGWNFIAATFDGSEVSLYCDGYVKVRQIIRGTPVSTTNLFKIGADLQGDIRRLIVLNEAVSSETILQKMVSTWKQDESNVTAYFDFSVNPPVDKSINQWPLSLKNGAQILQKTPSTLFQSTAYVQPDRDNSVNPGGTGTGNDPYTIQAWICTTTNAPKQAIFVNTDAEGSKGVSLWLAYNSSGGGFNLKATHGTFDGGISDSVTSATILQADHWYNVACTYDGTTLSLYINGTLDSGSGAVSTTVQLSDNHLIIGSSIKDGWPANAYSWLGYIQSVYIWTQANSAANITKYMNTDPVQSTNIAAAYGLDIPPAKNRVTGATLGLCNGAYTTLFISSVGTGVSKLAQELDPDEIYKPVLSAADLKVYRSQAEKPDIVDALRQAKEQDLAGDLAGVVPQAHLARAEHLVAAEYDRVISDAQEDLFQIGFTQWHRHEGYEVLIYHGPEGSEELHRVELEMFSTCVLWRIQVIWTIVMGILSVTGITAKLSSQAQTFINNRILNNQPVMQVISQNATGINAAKLFTLVTTLYSAGVLWPLIKMILTSLTWWAITWILTKIAAKYFTGAGVAETIARLVVFVAQFIIVMGKQPEECPLLPAEESI